MGKDAYETTEENCVNLDCCKLIDEKSKATPSLVARIKSHYCTKSNYKQCARFHVYQALGVDAIPALMLPKQMDWAQQIVEDLASETDLEQKSVESR